MSYKIFTGSSCEVLGQAIAKHLKTSLGKMTRQVFPCGETYVRFEETIRGQKVFLLQTGRTGQMNSDLMELLLMIDAAKQSFAKEIHVVLPYFPYCRQDKIHEPREGISAKLVAELIGAAGADHITTLKLHTDQIQGFFPVATDHVSTDQLMIDYLKTQDLQDLVIASPDAGGAKSAKRFSDALGVPLVILNKHRPEQCQSEVTHVIGDVAGKRPVLVDDIVDGAGSACAAKKALVDQGAQDDVMIWAPHAVFSGEAQQKLKKAAFKKIFISDTLPVQSVLDNLEVLSVAPLLADTIQRVATDKSVSQR